ncbi:MAG TPA: hypothetical protein VH138_00610 [Vicinamibacterales bacterium]|jgi:hypothetical protein|nr:hypothetical protein [Vicinamibacterales bacterium]
MRRLLLAVCLLWPSTVAAQQPFYTDDADVTARGKVHFDFFNEYDWLKDGQAPHHLQRGQLQALAGGNYDMGHGLTFDVGLLGGWYVATPTFGIQVGLSVDVK